MKYKKLKFLSLGLSIFTLLVMTSGIVLRPSQASAATPDSATATVICNNINQNYNSAELAQCVKGFGEGYAQASTGGTGLCQDQQNNTNNYNACIAGVHAGAQAADSRTGNGAAACGGYATNSGASIACNYAYTLGKKAQGQSYCGGIKSKLGSSGTSIYDACNVGYQDGVAYTAGFNNGSKACSTYSSNKNQYDACQLGASAHVASVGAGTQTCPSGDTGTYPNCACPSGDTGTYPSCIAPITAPAPPTCESTSSFSLSWMVCPFVEQMQGWLNSLNNEIENLLTLNVSTYFNDTCVNNYAVTGSTTGTDCPTTTANYQLWTNARDISLSLLTVVALIMVIATALDVGPFDAYTVKKMMPRILLAVIAITFSWELGRALVEFSNVLGAGVGQLILSVIKVPAGVDGSSTAAILNYISSNVLGWLTGGEVAGGVAVAGAVALAAVGPLALLLLLAPALLALVIGFFILIARQLIVVICIVFAPFALITFVIPGAQKAWKVWQQAFFGAIFLYPLVIGAICMGALLAYLVSNGDVSSYSAGIAPFIALVLLIAPYFLLPRIARMSSGALGTFANGANSATQGLNKWLHQKQRTKMADSWDKAKKGDLWHGYGWLPGSHRLAQRTSAITRGVGTGWSGHYGIGARGRQGVYSANDIASGEYMKTEKFGAIREWDAALQAKTYKNATEATRGLRDDFGMTDDASIHEAVEAARVSGGFGGYQSIAAARGLIGTGTGYLDTKRPNGTQVSAMQQMVETIDRVSNGSASTATSLAGFSNTYTKQSRPDLAPSFGELNNLVLAKGGHISGIHNHTGGPTSRDYELSTDKAFLASGGVHQVLGAKSQAMQKFVDRNLHNLEHGNPVQKRIAALNMAELHGNITSATGDNREVINKALFKLRDANGTRRGADPNDSVYEAIARVATTDAAGNKLPVGVAAVDYGAVKDAAGNVKTLTAESIQSMARVYSQDPRISQQQQQQQQQGGTQAPPTPPPGT